ncbi:hypothetical protein [Amycolatopsis albispora]|uniref:Uncharacterized protein n=1 Tax=Amycolatopsis albispora TaxID=1804986 RepID=A0A344KZP4_9PSEU|nr:hypothetical protein [Amycolatopsis albispora]AXB41268.1 hypothetical protein A4R43_01010 [Amycolatopsis albispora]
MTGKPAQPVLSDGDLERLGISRNLAEYVADIADDHGPLTPAQRDQLAVLLRPDPTKRLARGA